MGRLVKYLEALRSKLAARSKRARTYRCGHGELIDWEKGWALAEAKAREELKAVVGREFKM